MSRLLITGLVVVSLTAACGDDAESTPTSTPTSTAPASVAPTTIGETATSTTVPTTTSTTAPAPTTSSSPTTVPTTTVPPTTVPPTTVPPTTVPAEFPVVAVWPAPDVVFDTPEGAAADFIDQVFGVEPLLGEFLQGDSRSGEIEVLSPLDDDDASTTSPAGVVLFLRQLGPTDSWFVLSAASEGVTIDQPEWGAEVDAGELVVEGTGRGFEGTVVVRAIVPGDPPTELDLEITATDWSTPVPYEAALDLSGTSPGDVVALIARGDTGIVATGEFAAIPVIIG